MLKGYEVGEFSSVFSMTLFTPVFAILTAFLFFGERPSLVGAIGIFLILVGLAYIGAKPAEEGQSDGHRLKDIRTGNIYGIIVALIFSVSVNFDKLAVRYSDIFFSGAFITGFIALLNALYLLFSDRQKAYFINERKSAFGVAALFVIGIFSAGTFIFYNAAISSGLVSYTIAIKRTGILFGILWGWLFFCEKKLRQKLVGVVIALGGVFLIFASL